MNKMKSEISKIAQAPGVVAIFKSTTKDTEFYQPDTTLPPWRAVLETTTQVLSHTGESEVKIALDKHSIVVQRSGDIIIGVVVIKSHPVVKSLKRMIRRCFKQASPTKTEPEVASVVNDTAPVTPAVEALHPSLLKDEEPSGLPN